MTHKTHAIVLGPLRLATWGGKGYLMSTRGYAASIKLGQRILSVEAYTERQK